MAALQRGARSIGVTYGRSKQTGRLKRTLPLFLNIPENPEILRLEYYN